MGVLIGAGEEKEHGSHGGREGGGCNWRMEFGGPL